MDKSKEKNSKKIYTEDKKLSEKILDLCLWYQIEDSNLTIKMISQQIDFCNLQKEHLLDNKPFWFRKEKLKKWKKELEEIDKKILKYYEDVGKEVAIINKMQNAINKEETKIEEGNSNISYYDLLTLLKSQTIPKRLKLKIANKEEIYKFDDEANYVLEDEESKNDIFEYYLSDSLTDLSKLEKNIAILK